MLTKMLSGGIVVLMLAFGVFYWNHQRVVRNMTAQIETLQGEKLALEIENQARQATIDYLEKAKQVKVRVDREKKQVKEVVESGDLGRIRDLYQQYRVRPQGKDGAAGGGGGGSPKD